MQRRPMSGVLPLEDIIHIEEVMPGTIPIWIISVLELEEFILV